MPFTEMDLETRLAMDRLCAVVLGGGRGSRLYPLTALRAKPAVPLMGRYRLIDIPLSNCIHSNIRRIFVLTQFNSASLNRHVNNSYKFDNFSKGFVEILAAEQTIESGDWYQGTADAVRQHVRRLSMLGADHYLILSGDQLYRMDYRKLMAFHLRSKADITVATLPVGREATKGFGILKVQHNGRIKEFVEKPSEEAQLASLATPETTFKHYGINAGDRQWLASMGIYVFRAEVLHDILERRGDWIDFGKHVIPHSLKTHKVFAHMFLGFWEDIGTVGSYYETHMRMVQPDPPFQFYDPNHIIYTHPRYLPGVKLLDARIKKSLLCEGSRISQAEITESVVGIRSVIRPGAKISRSILMGADFLLDEDKDTGGVPIGIGRNARISGAIVDKNARIGDNVVIRGSRSLQDQEGDGWAVADGIVVVKKNAVIPSGTRIG